MNSNQIKLLKKCRLYIQDNLRAPPWRLVKHWGDNLKLSHQDTKHVSDQLSLRYKLGSTMIF